MEMKGENYVAIVGKEGESPNHDDVIVRIASKIIAKAMYEKLIQPVDVKSQLNCMVNTDTKDLREAILGLKFLRALNNSARFENSKRNTFIDYMANRTNRETVIQNLSQAIFKKITGYFCYKSLNLLDTGINTLHVSDYGICSDLRKPLERGGYKSSMDPLKWNFCIRSDQKGHEALCKEKISYEVVDTKGFKTEFHYMPKPIVAGEMTDVKVSAHVELPEAVKVADAFLDYMEGIIMCPIALDVPEFPVIAADGRTYDRVMIEAHFANSDKSPMTNMSIPTELVPNKRIAAIILHMQEMRKELKELASEKELPMVDVKLTAILREYQGVFEKVLNDHCKVKDICSEQLKEALIEMKTLEDNCRKANSTLDVVKKYP
jgi:U-box domain